MPAADHEPRTWTEPATVVIHEVLMPHFEAWLASRSLLLIGPARMSNDPEDLVWTVGPRSEDFLAARAGDTGPYDRSARLRAMGISEEQERDIRQRGAEQRMALRAEDEERLAKLRATEDYPGE